jgi:hypothetical protein
MVSPAVMGCAAGCSASSGRDVSHSRTGSGTAKCAHESHTATRPGGPSLHPAPRDPDVDDVHTTSLITIDGLTIDTGDCVFAAWRPCSSPRRGPCHRLGRAGPSPCRGALRPRPTEPLSSILPQRRICTAQSARECPCLVSRNRTERQIGIGVGSFPAPWLIKSGTLSPVTREPVDLLRHGCLAENPLAPLSRRMVVWWSAPRPFSSAR